MRKKPEVTNTPAIKKVTQKPKKKRGERVVGMRKATVWYALKGEHKYMDYEYGKGICKILR